MEEFIMNQVIIRDVEKKDLPALKAIINESWRVERLIKNESTLGGSARNSPKPIAT